MKNRITLLVILSTLIAQFTAPVAAKPQGMYIGYICNLLAGRPLSGPPNGNQPGTHLLWVKYDTQFYVYGEEVNEYGKGRLLLHKESGATAFIQGWVNSTDCKTLTAP